MVKQQKKQDQNMNNYKQLKRKKIRKVNAKPKAQNAIVPHPVIHMPETTSDYLKSLCDPSAYRAIGIPSSDNVGSQTSLKQHVFGKGTFQIGTGGWGYAMLNCGGAVASDGPAVQGSTASYPGTTVGGGIGAEIFVNNSNSMFQQADFGVSPLASYRIVSAVLRIRYAGTQLNLGGTVRALQHPTHETLGGLNAAAIEGFRQAKRFPVSREWDHVVYCPLTDQYNTNPGVTVSGPYALPFMACLVSSTPGNEFEYEYYINYEIIGRNIRGQTACIKDPTGYGAITAAMAVEGGSFRGSPKRMEKSVFDIVKEYLVRASTWIGGTAEKVLPVVLEHTPAILNAAAALM